MTLARIFHHGRCFDGAVSAALMMRLLDAVTGRPLAFETRGMAHGNSAPWGPGTFDADISAVVDFRYSADPGLGWWFDHHPSTFLSPGDRQHFEAHPTPQKQLDPRSPSCARLIHAVARRDFGVDLTPRDPGLIAWADVIDAAAFPTPRMAVRLEEPELQLMTWLEAVATPDLEARVVAALAREAPVAELLAWPEVAAGLEPALARHLELMDLIRSRLHVAAGVATIDLADRELAGVNKFIAYDADPEILYTVTVLRPPGKAKISVGSNPWAQDRRRHDLGALCERYGGGGHPGVGAITLPGGAIDRARAIAAEVAAVLRE